MLPSFAVRCLAALLAVGALSAAPAHALSIDYTAQLLDAATQRWSYTYTMVDLKVYSNATLLAGQVLDLDFDPGQYADLQLTGPGPGSDWSAMAIQPDPLLPALGYYDLQAQRTNPDLTGPFQISFTWKGAGTPGWQQFDIYDVDYRYLTGGSTTLAVPVPEPGTLAMLFAGLAGMLAARRWRRAGARGLLLAGLAAGGAAQAQLSVDHYDLTGNQRANRTQFDYTYQVTFRNQGGALKDAVATVTSRSPATLIIDGSVNIGTMAANANTTSYDTITIRQDRTLPFDPASLAWQFSSNPSNRPPVAVATVDAANSTVGQIVTFNGLASSDPDGDPIGFSWGVLNRPAGSTTQIGNAQSGLASLRLDRAGSFQVQLLVNDGKLNSVPAVLTVGVSMPSHGLPYLSLPSGPGSEADTLAYYGSQPIKSCWWVGASNSPWVCDGPSGAPQDVLSWESQTGVRQATFNGYPVTRLAPITAVFYDDTSLAVARSMNCYSVPNTDLAMNGPGISCIASNHGPLPGQAGFPNPDAALGDAIAGRNPLSYSALWFSPTVGLTFQDFLPDTGYDPIVYPRDNYYFSRLQTSAQFDSEGRKQVPQACIACHGGSLNAATHQLSGASMLPFIVADMKFSTQPGYTRADQEGALRDLNRLVLGTRPNPNDPNDPIAVWINGTYANFTRGSADDGFLPPQWSGDPVLYRKVVRPYCISCHQALPSTINFASSWNFRGLAAQIANLVCSARTMPHSEAAFVGLRQSDALQVLKQQLLGGGACP
ncbi:MAG: PEP-CTERM sorting domain-containing protein [Burkholderiales bacterium]|nr:PEP-CTERM sorting domain-containing protein [Burkholderiales bacterium]